MSTEFYEIPIQVGEGATKLEILLRRRRPAPRRAPAVLLLHGGSTSGDIFMAPHGGIAAFLADAGLDVWVLDWRGSPRIVRPLLERAPLGGSVSAEIATFSLDAVVAEDIPGALTAIRNEVGHDVDLAILGLCLGSGTACLAAARGVLEPFRVTHLVLLTLGLFYQVPTTGWLKAADFILERVLGNEPACRAIDPTAPGGWPEDVRHEYERWPRAWLPPGDLPASDLVRRLAFMMGQSFSLDRIDPSIGDVTRFFGPLHLGLYLHAGQNIRRAFAAPFDAPERVEGQGAGLRGGGPPRRSDLTATHFSNKKTTLVAAANNRVWHRDSIDLMYEWLRNSGCTDCSKYVAPGDNLLELLWSKDAHRDVYPAIAAAMPGVSSGPPPALDLRSAPPSPASRSAGHPLSALGEGTAPPSE